jgi:hypothetical protein
MYSKSLIDREIWEGTQDFSINVFQETSCSVQDELDVSDWEEVCITDL